MLSGVIGTAERLQVRLPKIRARHQDPRLLVHARQTQQRHRCTAEIQVRRAAGAAIAWLYGFGLEIGQGFVPGRVTSMGDMILNSIGILSAILIASALPRLKTIRSDGER